MSRPSLSVLFDPRAVAIVGASADPAKVGGSVLANLRATAFAGRVIPVKVAVIAVPADDVLRALKDCVAQRIGAAVVISAGFREAGAVGRAACPPPSSTGHVNTASGSRGLPASATRRTSPRPS